MSNKLDTATKVWGWLVWIGLMILMGLIFGFGCQPFSYSGY